MNTNGHGYVARPGRDISPRCPRGVQPRNSCESIRPFECEDSACADAGGDGWASRPYQYNAEEVQQKLDNQPPRRYLVCMKAISELAKEALELPPAQRLTLARILLDLSEENPDFSPDLEAAWEEEIVRRMDEVKAGRARSCGVNEVFDRLDRRFPS